MDNSFLETHSQYYDECVDPLLPAPKAFFIRAEHYSRYLFAKWFVHQKKAKTVYDIACGDGYGTNIIASGTKNVYGFDSSEAFLTHAKSHYSANNIQYLAIDLNKKSLPSYTLPKPDVIVSFETLEHVEDPKRLLQMFYDFLPSGGYLLLSTPNARLEPKKKGKSRNKFHKHIFEREELFFLLKDAGFVVNTIYGQSFTNILLHNKFIRDLLNKITQRSLFLFKVFALIGWPCKLFQDRSYSMIVIARKK